MQPTAPSCPPPTASGSCCGMARAIRLAPIRLCSVNSARPLTAGACIISAPSNSEILWSRDPPPTRPTSLRANTRHLEQLEVVLVVDHDDEPSVAFQYEGLNIRKVEVAPGLAMGSLNMAGYRAATGKYLMLLNDDIVLQTPGWDERVMEAFRNYSDGIVLVHVNETIFGARLCTFPFLPRTFCELAGGICPEE